MKRKLIEVALPLETINRESAREKEPFTRNHPRSVHIWWARRPLAACRAVLFAQLVDDPSARPDRFPTDEDQARERKRLFDLIERLVVWENATDEALLRQAHAEIAKCFRGSLPAILDPFAGGGSIPLEAQRLGLEAHASDLNPVAVLINKALIEIPPRWDGQPPVFPNAADEKLIDATAWPWANGLAEDVRRYGKWMQEEGERRIGEFYPKATLPGGTASTVIAWIWARTITCPNPACQAKMPLARTFWLSKRRGRETWLRPLVHRNKITFDVVSDPSGPTADGTVGRQGAKCLVCNEPVPLAYIRGEGAAHRMGQQLMAVVAEQGRQRTFLPATPGHIAAAVLDRPADSPEAELPDKALGFRVQAYGMTRWADLFTNRQLLALTTFSDLVKEAQEGVAADAQAAGLCESDATDYASAVATYLALAVSRFADLSNTICSWNTANQNIRALFSRQAVPMSWDFVEANPLGPISPSGPIDSIANALSALRPNANGSATQADATKIALSDIVIATDPPYYDNIGYADLSDFFYVWLRRSLLTTYPDLLGTMLTPKTEELIATPYRFAGSRARAEEHFETGFVRAFASIRAAQSNDVPITVFYAFKQAETDEGGTASTGWETMLSGLIDAGLAVTATWPMRTERSSRSVGLGTNALASSIVLACRPREAMAEAIARRGFLQALHEELPAALRELQQGSIAPVDLAQAAIGPGMAVFTRYRTVVEADGSAMTVRTALALINQVLDEVLAEQEGDFDADTRFCVKWFSQFGWDESDSGTADTLSRATNTSIAGLERGGVFRARAGRARLLAPDELSADWDPLSDARVSIWEVVVRLAGSLATGGLEDAARLVAGARQRVDMDTAKELAYLLFALGEKKGWTQSALLFNGLGTSWHDLTSAAERITGPAPAQGLLDFDSVEG